MMDEEQTLWEGTPSHKKDIGFYVFCALICWTIIPVFAALGRYLSTKNHTIVVTNERITVTTGVLSKRMDELELYRVKDSRVDEPFLLRIFGLGNVVLATSDATDPTLVIPGITDAKTLRQNLRGCVEKMREVKQVREVDRS
jgi:uncharacterized membrane protein YdbT with pleckstrin-like domain